MLEDDGSRSISCINSSKNFCDNQLSTDWYRVVKDASDILMPTECVNMLSCGTTYPVWLNGYYWFIVVSYIDSNGSDLIYTIIIYQLSVAIYITKISTF